MKTAIVTGSSSLMGQSLVEKFLEQNYKVIGICRTASLYHKENKSFVPLEFDLSKKAGIESAVKDSLKKIDRLDLLVHFVGGIGQTERHEWMDVNYEDWMANFQVNVLAPVFLSQGLFSLLKQTGNSHVVFVSSYSAQTPGQSHPEYISAKSALEGASRFYAQKWAKDGITVSLLSPRFVNSKSSPRTLENGQGKLHPDEISSQILKIVQGGS